MVEVLEFKNITELNDYLRGRKFASEFDIIPIAKMFENDSGKLINVTSYVLVLS